MTLLKIGHFYAAYYKPINYFVEAEESDSIEIIKLKLNDINPGLTISKMVFSRFYHSLGKHPSYYSCILEDHHTLEEAGVVFRTVSTTSFRSKKGIILTLRC